MRGRCWVATQGRDEKEGDRVVGVGGGEGVWPGVVPGYTILDKGFSDSCAWAVLLRSLLHSVVSREILSVYTHRTVTEHGRVVPNRAVACLRLFLPAVPGRESTNEEARAELDPNHIWETPRNTGTTSWGGERSTDILLVWDNESAKFGVFMFMWLLWTRKSMLRMIKCEMYTWRHLLQEWLL